MILKKLFWQFYFSFLLMTVIVIVAITLLASKLFSNSFMLETQQTLKTDAKFISPTISQFILKSEMDSIDPFCKQLGSGNDTRITVILPDGRVVGDSEENPANMSNHKDRPEILTAKDRNIGIEERYSETLNQRMMYVAIPILHDGNLLAVIRTSKPLITIATSLRNLYKDIAKQSLIIIVISASLCLVITRRINRPLTSIISGLDNFAKGNFNHSLEIPKTQELAKLAVAMNDMATELDIKIKDLVSQKNETQAILTSMSEGVIALNSTGKILSINNAAKTLLYIDKNCQTGKNHEEVLRNATLQNFVKDSLHSQSQIETEIKLAEKETDKFLRACSNTLIDSENETIGTIIVLSDITLLRNLEQIRSEFVANVSHELKTPITSIKGFVETLLDGAINNPEEAKRFMEIIARQTDRLNAIIEDILILSKIEDQSNLNLIELENDNISDAIDSAIEICQLKSQQKEITIKTDLTEINAPINEFLLEQAIINLLSNAIKYSEPQKNIEISLTKNDKYARIAVTDHGYGISQEHAQRVFERFYVVDKARSRNLGGTGLGLAIVKHIAQAHGGFVSIVSELGKGSTFAIHIPIVS